MMARKVNWGDMQLEATKQQNMSRNLIRVRKPQGSKNTPNLKAVRAGEKAVVGEC